MEENNNQSQEFDEPEANEEFDAELNPKIMNDIKSREMNRFSKKKKRNLPRWMK